MLKQRIITAVILLALLVPALLARNALYFNVLTLVLMAAGAWEWGRMQGLIAPWSVLFGVGIAALLWTLLALGVDPSQFKLLLSWCVLLMWGPGLAWMLRKGLTQWSSLHLVLRLCLGWCAIAMAWLALVYAKSMGLNFLASILALVWAADIAAYFGGRAWGRSKLAPQISPGKTWAGAWSGVVAACVVAVIWIWADTHFAAQDLSVYTQLWQRWHWGAAIGLVVLVSLSIAGDLVESMVKRVAGIKDSSGLLPGHGGVLDRIDALLPVLPAAVALAWW
ncbi:MAG: hypothetical protein RL357_168 [Pseudomonadota bacterium]|jgi:phosphatidate cytidylyltransferase